MEDQLNPTPSEETPQAVETQPLPEEGLTAQNPARSRKWYILGAVLVIFLASAAFLGARLIKSPASTEAGKGLGPSLSLNSKNGGPAKSVRLNMIPATEVPQDRPTANGIFVRREDQSIFIGTGNIQVAIKKSSSSSSGDVSSRYDGPVVEVVVNHETKVYQDITEMTPPESANNGVATVKQVVKPGSLDDLGANSMVTVWGEKQGDRFIAKTLVFR